MASSPQPVPSLLGHDGIRGVPPEEVRFAVVLNGGVSLAVWMGGVVLEIDRLTKADPGGPGAYSVLKRLTGCSARADVITGTSAGGINGAALALTQVNRGADPALLRDLWIDQGRLETLLRQPFRGQPSSLLRGDEYFLPQLNAALGLLAKPHDHRGPQEAPIDLTITTTVLSGNQSVSVDSMGQRLPQRLHAGRFRWQRQARATREQDPFSQAHLERTAHRLALAARCSASFPVAFEPSFVPVDNPDHREPDHGRELTDELRLRPDMAGVVTSWGSAAQGQDRSRFCVDGGALANTPTREALEAIEAMPAGGPVRRVMLLVFPHAPAEAEDPPDLGDQPPTVAGALGGLLGALTAQGSRTYVEELERHNLAAAGRRGTRHDLVEQLDSPEALASLTDSIHEQYRRLRRWRAGRDLAAWRTGMDNDGGPAAERLPSGWSFDRVRANAELAQTAWERDPHAPAGREPLPYAPVDLPSPATVERPGWGWGVTAALGVSEAASDLLRRAVWLLHDPNASGAQADDAAAPAPAGPSTPVPSPRPPSDFERVESARRTIFDLAPRLRDARRLTDRPWQENPALVRLAPDAAYWTLRLACYDHLMVGSVTREEVRAAAEKVTGEVDGEDVATEDVVAAVDAFLDECGRGHVGEVVQDLVRRTVSTLRDVLPVLARCERSGPGRDSGLAGWLRVLAPEEHPETIPVETLLARLLQLEIASTTLGDEVVTGASIPVELVQVSAQTTNAFARYSRSAADKLGGDAISRFGGFLKRSWRVNDWIWGRADGATMLARTMLDPHRIRRAARLSGYVDPDREGEDPAALAEATVDDVLATVGACPQARALRSPAVEELTAVLDVRGTGDAALPSELPALAEIFGWALHLDSVPSELPALAQAVAADRVDGANPRSRGEVLVEEHADLLRRLDAAQRTADGPDQADRRRALDVFDRAGIGREPLREEAGSDQMIRTAAAAAAVVSTVADSSHSGLGAAKPVTRSLRGAMLLPYWALWGLTSRQTLARALALLAFALGGTALALALLGVLPTTLQPVAAALGGGAVLAAFAYGALRTGSLLHGIVLLVPVVPLLAYAGTAADGGASGGSTLVVVGVLAVGLMLLGSIPMASGSVWASLDRLADRQGFVRPEPWVTSGQRVWWTVKTWLRRLLALVWGGLSILGVLLTVAVLTVVVRWLSAADRITWVQEHRGVLVVLTVAVVVVGGAAAHAGGRALQVLSFRPRPGDRHPRWEYVPVVDAGAVAAGWSVVYGTGFVVVAWAISLGLLGDTGPLWLRVAFATAVVFAVVLLVVLPVLLPWRSARAVARAEVDRAADLPAPGTVPSVGVRRRVFADDLVLRGTGHRAHLRRPRRDAVGREQVRPILTRAGERLEQRVSHARAGATLRRRWAAPRTLSSQDVARLREVLPDWRAGQGRVVTDGPATMLTKLEQVLAEENPDPRQVRYAADRLLAALRRNRAR
jgi:patatin-related protein